MQLSAFKKKTGFQAPATMLERMVEAVEQQVRGDQMVRVDTARHALSLENLNDSAQHSLIQAGENLSTALEAITSDLGIASQATQAQVEAATYAGILAGDYRGFLSHKADGIKVSTESAVVVPSFGIADAVETRSFGLEAYDDRDNKSAVAYSIAYNYQAARQDEFGEAFFPTITMAPGVGQMAITVNLMMVYDGIERKISGAATAYKKKNIIRAVADASVLKKQQTKIVPVYRAQSQAQFAVGIPSVNLDVEGEVIPTAPLAFGKVVDLLALSQTDALLSAGVMDMTDSLDPLVALQNVYVKFGDDIIKIQTGNLPLSNFVATSQNNYRVQNLNFITNSPLVNKFTKNLDGSALDTLSAIVTGDLIVRLKMRISGDVNIETGETSVFGNALAVETIIDAATGNSLDLTSGVGLTVSNLIAAGTLLGYDLLAYRTNMNRRQRGQLIDVTRFSQVYDVPLLSPITAIHPITTDGQTDASDVQALITATRIRTSNESVTALLDAAATLSQYVDARDAAGTGPDVMGVGRFFVLPTFQAAELDMATAINSLTSHERAQDIQAVLVNKLRDMAYRLYRDSEYKAAADALAGGMAPTPTVIIGTDPVIARYLTVTGDLRTLGDGFDVKIVHTLDSRMKGKIVVAFGSFDESRNTAPNPLGFGNMLWSPELVLTANISRAGTISKETVVQPKFRFVTHCPIMGLINVLNIPSVVSSKLSIAFDQV
jgi:hypothetical protein